MYYVKERKKMELIKIFLFFVATIGLAMFVGFTFLIITSYWKDLVKNITNAFTRMNEDT